MSDTTPKSRRTAGTVSVTNFRNRMRKSVTFCRKCGRKIPQERRRNGWGLSAVPASPRLQVCRSRPRVRFARQAALPRCVQTSKRTLRPFACNARFAAQVSTASPLAAYFYLLIHLTTLPQFDTIRLYVIVVRYIFRRKTNKSVARGRVRNNKEKRYEKNLPTKKTSKKQSARFPRKNENNRRSSRACSSSQQGSSRTLRLIEAIREVYLQT